jgi:hypothetical protein
MSDDKMFHVMEGLCKEVVVAWSTHYPTISLQDLREAS